MIPSMMRNKMVDRTEDTNQECIDSLIEIIRVVKETKAQLKLYEQVLIESQNEFIRRFAKESQIEFLKRFAKVK